VVPDGIDIKSFLGLGDMVYNVALDLGLFELDVVMFYPSRMLKRKNYELAIKIIKAVKDKNKRCVLLLSAPVDPHNIKTIKYRIKLENLIKELKVEREVIFIHDLIDKHRLKTSISYGELQDFYNISDILLFTSSQEGFGLPLLEGGAKRISIVCSDIGPFREIAGRDAVLFELDEKPDEIAGRIISFLNKQSTYRMFKKVCRIYSWKNIYKNYFKKLVR
jgi:glycosyltransferase involved in cell wall biosynthesis